MSYKYKNPVDHGNVQAYITKQQHNELFPNRQTTWWNHYDYYLSDAGILLERTVSVGGVVITLLLFPISVLIYGLGNFSEVYDDHRKLLNQKKFGAFSSDVVSSRSEKYQKFRELMK